MLLKILSFYHKKRLLVNALLSVCQVIVIGGTYFILYSIVLKTLGSVKLGTWSLILSTTSIATLANSGLSSSLVKYIASYSPEIDFKQISNLIKTGLISIAVFISLVALLLYGIASYALPKVLSGNELQEGMILLPLSLFSLTINGIGGIFLSAIDGLHYSSLRSIIYIISSMFFLLFGYFLLQYYGLLGVAIAQILQSSVVLLFAAIAVKSIFKNFNIFPLYWDKPTFKLIFKYSFNFQIIGLFQLFYDPITKFLLTKYGNLSFVGFFELASRLVTQVRALIVSANQVIVPTVASRTRNESNVEDTLYPKVLNLIIFITFPTAVTLIILTPYISYYWFGYYEQYFIFSVIILSLGYFLNLLSVPAYFSNMGIGELKENLISQVAMAVLNGLIGYFLGYFFNGWGVVIGWSISIFIGGLITVILYHKRYKISFKVFGKRSIIKIIMYSLLFSAIGLFTYFLESAYLKPIYLLVLNVLILFIYYKVVLSNNLYFILFFDKVKLEAKKLLIND